MKRFQVVSVEELPDWEEGMENYDYRHALVEVDKDGNIIRDIAWDGGEPEDNSFLRDYSWVCDELNKVNEEHE
jgi:hypothetical protein